MRDKWAVLAGWYALVALIAAGAVASFPLTEAFAFLAATRPIVGPLSWVRPSPPSSIRNNLARSASSSCSQRGSVPLPDGSVLTAVASALLGL